MNHALKHPAICLVLEYSLSPCIFTFASSRGLNYVPCSQIHMSKPNFNSDYFQLCLTFLLITSGTYVLGSLNKQAWIQIYSSGQNSLFLFFFLFPYFCFILFFAILLLCLFKTQTSSYNALRISCLEIKEGIVVACRKWMIYITWKPAWLGFLLIRVCVCAVCVYERRPPWRKKYNNIMFQENYLMF